MRRGSRSAGGSGPVARPTRPRAGAGRPFEPQGARPPREPHPGRAGRAGLRAGSVGEGLDDGQAGPEPVALLPVAGLAAVRPGGGAGQGYSAAATPERGEGEWGGGGGVPGAGW
jgi:hypothetical protein